MVENALVDKTYEVGQDIQAEGNILNLFALLQREDSADNWDLLISSKSFKYNDKDIIKNLSERLQKKLTNTELKGLSRIVVFKADHPFVKSLNSAMSVSNSKISIENSTFNGINIKKMHLFSSQKA